MNNEILWERMFKCISCGNIHRVKSIRRQLDKEQQVRERKCAESIIKAREDK